MNPHLQRARLLIDQRRFAEAERELAGALAQEPDDALAHSLLAQCLLRREQYDEATQHAEQAVGLAPDWPATHYFLALVWLARNDPQKAEAAVREAVALDPLDADSQLLLGRIHYAQTRWEPALEAAEAALVIEPEHLGALNLRAEALRKLRRSGPAEEQLRSALAIDADNPNTHANLGWLSLEKGDRAAALRHFREALRLDPESEWARRGIVEAIKAGNPVYRLFLKYVFAMQRLGGGKQWLVVLAVWVVFSVARGAAERSPWLSRWIWLLLAVYLAMVLTTWLASPLANLALRLHPFGRLALSDEERRSSTWIGGFLFAALAAGISYLVYPTESAIAIGLYAGLMILPLAATTAVRPPKPHRLMVMYTAALGALGLYPCVMTFVPEALVETLPDTVELVLRTLSWLCVNGFVLGALLSLLAGNVVMSIRWKR